MALFGRDTTCELYNGITTRFQSALRNDKLRRNYRHRSAQSRSDWLIYYYINYILTALL